MSNLTNLSPQIYKQAAEKLLRKTVNIIKSYTFTEIYLRFNPHNKPVIADKENILLFHFYKWENWSSMKLWFAQIPDKEINHFDP